MAGDPLADMAAFDNLLNGADLQSFQADLRERGVDLSTDHSLAARYLTVDRELKQQADAIIRREYACGRNEIAAEHDVQLHGKRRQLTDYLYGRDLAAACEKLAGELPAEKQAAIEAHLSLTEISRRGVTYQGRILESLAQTVPEGEGHEQAWRAIVKDAKRLGKGEGDRERFDEERAAILQALMLDQHVSGDDAEKWDSVYEISKALRSRKLRASLYHVLSNYKPDDMKRPISARLRMALNV